MTCSQKKCELRKQLLATANSLETEKGEIAKKVLALPQWQNAKTVFCYVSYKYEPDTMPILRAAFAQNKRVCVPFCIGGGIMKALQIHSLEDLSLGKFNILTPYENADEILPLDIDLAVIPCLGADINGGRIGKGGGYYDRFLLKCRQSCYKVLLCRKELIAQNIPFEKHDIKADILIL